MKGRPERSTNPISTGFSCISRFEPPLFPKFISIKLSDYRKPKKNLNFFLPNSGRQFISVIDSYRRI